MPTSLPCTLVRLRPYRVSSAYFTALYSRRSLPLQKPGAMGVRGHPQPLRGDRKRGHSGKSYTWVLAGRLQSPDGGRWSRATAAGARVATGSEGRGGDHAAQAL